jgi:hypothetical protein
MSALHTSPQRYKSLGSALLGALLIACFALSAYGPVGMQIQYRPPWQSFGAGELMFWFNNLLLLLPGCLMIGWGLSAPLAPSIQRALPALSRWQHPSIYLFVFIVLFILFFTLRRVVLFDLPITDDEHAARFGGQVLASGRWRMPVSPLWPSLPHEFIYVHKGTSYQSFDWPGILFAWAIATKTGLQSALFTLAAATTPLLLASGVARRHTPAWGAVALLLALCSPMVQTLSWTSHAHILSRAGLAATLAALWWARAGASPARWALVGALWGASMLVRPLECAALGAPIILLAAWELVRARQLRSLLAGAAGVASVVALFMLSNYKITGDALVQARFAVFDQHASPHCKPPLGFLSDAALLRERLANNTAYNLSMILAWFATPLAAALGWLGVRDRWDAALLAGVASALALSLIHDDYGLHIVGPIHYSEVAVPLTYLLIGGLRQLHASLRDHAPRVVPALIAGLMLWGVATTAYQGRALHAQGLIHHTLYSTFEDDPRYHNSVILSSRYGEVWREDPTFKQTGAWVFQWRPVTPQRREPVIFLHHDPAMVPQLLLEFPDRKFFVLRGSAKPPHMKITTLEEHLHAQERRKRR